MRIRPQPRPKEGASSAVVDGEKVLVRAGDTKAKVKVKVKVKAKGNRLTYIIAIRVPCLVM